MRIYFQLGDVKLIDMITNDVWLVKGYYVGSHFEMNDEFGNYIGEIKQHVLIPEPIKKYFLALPNLKKRPFKFFINEYEQNQHFIKITSTGRFLESKRKGPAKLNIEIIGNLDVLSLIDDYRSGK